MNWMAVKSIYTQEMMRTFRTLAQSVLAPVISTSLYFVVFGAAIGSNIEQVDGIAYGAYIVPGLVMMMLLMQSVSNAAIGIYFPKFTGTVYEYLSAPISAIEIVLGFVGAAASKSIILGAIVIITAGFFVDLQIQHPIWMLGFLFLTAITFSLFGFILGIWAESFEQLNMVPMLLITPLAFLGGSFYSVSVLPEPWKTISFFNPVVYLISGFRWSFYSVSDVNVGISLLAIAVFLAVCMGVVVWIFKTGYRLKN